MEIENPQDEPLREMPDKKVMSKKDKQDTVLKQLNNQSLYPMQERIGIYVIAILSTIGLVLITYTGVMALVTSVTNGPDASVDVDIDELSEILDDLDELIDFNDEDDESSQSDTESEENIPASDSRISDIDRLTGTINSNGVQFVHEAGSTETVLFLHSGDEVNLINLDYNLYWSQVEVETDVFGGVETISGYIQREFINVD